MKQCPQHLCTFHPVSAIIPPAGYNPRQVVIIPEKTVPALSTELLLPFFPDLLKCHKGKGRQIPLISPRLLVQADMFKLKYHGKLTAVGIAELLRLLNIRSPGFSHRQIISASKGFPVHFPDKFMQPRTVAGNFPVRFLSYLVDNIQTESRHPLVQPPVHHFIKRPAHPFIVPV